MSKLHRHLPAPAFTLQDAAASGITRDQVVRGGTNRIALQIYALEGYSPQPEELLRLIHCTAPQAVIGSVSAARLLGMRLPPRLWQDPTVYLLQCQTPTRVRRKGVRCSRAVLKPEEVFTVNGVPCTTPERTFFDLAKVLSYRELIAVADGLLVHHEHRADQRVPIRTREQLQKYLRKHPGKRGIKKCRYAVENAVTGSDSYMESLLRFILQDAGVRGLECNVPVYDEFGNLLFQPDLALIGQKLSIQYEGEHHGGREQIRRDVNRARAVASVGWREVRIFSGDIYEKVWFRGEYIPRATMVVLTALEQ